MLSHTGTYALILASSSEGMLKIGRLGLLKLRPGFYIYVGSAFGPGGLAARISHHQKKTGRPRWHIDYLRTLTDLEEVWYTPDHQRREHQWAEVLAGSRGAILPMPGFGASDCSCESHLCFYSARPAGKFFQRMVRSKFRDHDQIFIKNLL